MKMYVYMCVFVYVYMYIYMFIFSVYTYRAMDCLAFIVYMIATVFSFVVIDYLNLAIIVSFIAGCHSIWKLARSIHSYRGPMIHGTAAKR